MSLDVYLETPVCEHCGRGPTEVYSRNITHNLAKMAKAAGVYQVLWHPEEIGVTYAQQLVEPLRVGLTWLRENPTQARALNSENGWGDYEGLMNFVEEYLAACEKYPNANVSVSR